MKIVEVGGPYRILESTETSGEFNVPVGGWWRLLVKGMPSAGTLSHSSWNPTQAPAYLPPTTIDTTVSATGEDKLRTDGSGKSGTLLVRLEAGPHRINTGTAGATISIAFAGGR